MQSIDKNEIHDSQNLLPSVHAGQLWLEKRPQKQYALAKAQTPNLNCFFRLYWVHLSLKAEPPSWTCSAWAWSCPENVFCVVGETIHLHSQPQMQSNLISWVQEDNEPGKTTVTFVHIPPFAFWYSSFPDGVLLRPFIPVALIVLKAIYDQEVDAGGRVSFIKERNSIRLATNDHILHTI